MSLVIGFQVQKLSQRTIRFYWGDCTQPPDCPSTVSSDGVGRINSCSQPQLNPRHSGAKTAPHSCPALGRNGLASVLLPPSVTGCELSWEGCADSKEGDGG